MKQPLLVVLAILALAGQPVSSLAASHNYLPECVGIEVNMVGTLDLHGKNGPCIIPAGISDEVLLPPSKTANGYSAFPDGIRIGVRGKLLRTGARFHFEDSSKTEIRKCDNDDAWRRWRYGAGLLANR